MDDRLMAINKSLDTLQGRREWLSAELWIPVVGTLVAAVGGWAVAFQSLKRTVAEQRKSQEQLTRMHLQDQVATSLKWFEGGSQKRSIGIADIEAHLGEPAFANFLQTWASVLVNQAIFLLAESDQTESLHEANNLVRILWLLRKLPATSYAPIREAYAARQMSQSDRKTKGVPLSPQIDHLIKQLPAM